MCHASAAFVNYDMNYIPFNRHLHTDTCNNTNNNVHCINYLVLTIVYFTTYTLLEIDFIFHKPSCVSLSLTLRNNLTRIVHSISGHSFVVTLREKKRSVFKLRRLQISSWSNNDKKYFTKNYLQGFLWIYILRIMVLVSFTVLMDN